MQTEHKVNMPFPITPDFKVAAGAVFDVCQGCGQMNLFLIDEKGNAFAAIAIPYSNPRVGLAHDLLAAEIDDDTIVVTKHPLIMQMVADHELRQTPAAGKA
jgi:hypothetical protein